MEFTPKDYTMQKIVNHVKKHSLFFLINNANTQSSKILIIEQELKKLNMKSFKILNKLAKKTFKTSVYNKFPYLINSYAAFLTPLASLLVKSVLLNSLKPLVLVLILVKLNNKLYSIEQLKDIYSLYYKKNILILYIFAIAKLKLYMEQN